MLQPKFVAVGAKSLFTAYSDGTLTFNFGWLNDLPQSGEVTFLAVVIEQEVRPKRNGGSFLAVRLADRSGELDAKVWDNPEAVAQLFECNDIVKVRGAMEHYNEKP